MLFNEKMQKIIFYDGDCGFCNKSVQFVLKNEKTSELFFAALQSDFAKHFFKERNLPHPDLSTFYFWNGSQLFQKSTGILKLLSYLKFQWRIFKIGYIFPKMWRDKLYDFIAKRRHQIHNKFCVVPNSDQKKRFLG